MNNTLEYFKQISQIPRESGNEEQISNYLLDFAKKHNFYCEKDSHNNVLIKKINSDKKPLILQAHTDMVCVKENSSNFDFKSQPIEFVFKGDYLFANKTSLGADNGIGLAMILSLLEEDIPCNIEALFTTDEEVTMTGALGFDYKKLRGTELLSFDGFSDQDLIVGCASICDMKVGFDKTKTKYLGDGKCFSLVVSNLKGGHSGDDIGKHVGNAIKVTFDLLNAFDDFQICDINAGKQYNAIPGDCDIKFFGKIDKVSFEKIKTKYEKEFPFINIKLEEIENIYEEALPKKVSKDIKNFVDNIEGGVLVGSPDDIILSLNLACIDFENGLIKLNHRGHDEKLEDQNIEDLKNLAFSFGFSFEIFDRQKGWNPVKNSYLQKLILKNSKEKFDKQFQIVNKHISLEGAIFKQKKPDLDIAIISPTITCIHSVNENVYLPSIEPIYNIAKEVLKEYI